MVGRLGGRSGQETLKMDDMTANLYGDGNDAVESRRKIIIII